MEKTHRLRWAEMRPSERRDAAVSFIGQVLKWAFVGAMCIFTLYPVIYTLLGSFKTNAELTLGGGILPEKWQIENYIYAFQKLLCIRPDVGTIRMGKHPRTVNSLPIKCIIRKLVRIAPCHLCRQEIIHAAALHDLRQGCAVAEGIRQPEAVGTISESAHRIALSP